MSVLKSRDELQKMHRACTIVVQTLEALAQAAQPGVTTRELDRLAHSRIVGAGRISPEAERLMRVTEEALRAGIAQVQPRNRLGDIGWAVQSHAEASGYGVVRELTGHGVGRELHEAPEVPNYGRRGHGVLLGSGMVIAIEPMINMGTKEVVQHDDGWTVATRDGKPSAHFEHTIAVRAQKAEVLTTFSHIEDVLKDKGVLV